MKLLLLLLFVGVLIYSGLVSMRKTRTVNDFFLGGRDVGPWLSAFAYGTTYFSAVIFIGYAGKVGWGFGLSSLWIVVGNTLVGSLLAWFVLAKRTRILTNRLNVMTMPEFLEVRYRSKNIKIFSALVIFIFLVPYSASVYMGLSYLFNQIFGIPYLYAAVFMCALTALYLVLGGYRAVALTDFIQGLVMIAGVGVLLYFVVNSEKVGGLAAGLQRLGEIDPGLVSVVGTPGWLPLASLMLLTSLGVWGMPQMVQKFYAIKDEAAIKPAMMVSTFFALVVTFGAYFTGGLTRLFFDTLPLDPATGKATPDMLMPMIINNTLPEIGAAIILLLVLSASMSTLASLVLVSSSSIAIDLYKAVSPNHSPKKGVVLMRLLCLVFIALSLIIALMKPAIILSLMAMSWGAVAGFFIAPYIYGLFWRGATPAGAWAGGLTGLSVAVGFALYYKLDAAVIPIVGSAAMLAPLVVLPAVSLVTKQLPEKHLLKVFGKLSGGGKGAEMSPKEVLLK
ncbi:sodium:solute symporter family transporter [Desulfocucumis palustris]|nr:sodium/solute symporter [Desulfocucumis palustris]